MTEELINIKPVSDSAYAMGDYYLKKPNLSTHGNWLHVFIPPPLSSLLWQPLLLKHYGYSHDNYRPSSPPVNLI